MDKGHHRVTTSSYQWQVPKHKIAFFTGRKKDVCLIIPTFNEGMRIASLLKKMSATKINSIADIIITDGQSRDGSVEPAILKKIAVTGLLIRTHKNDGRLGADLRSAFSFAIKKGYKKIITIDGNDKDDPKEIKHFITALNNGYDYIQASRFIKGGKGINTPLVRLIAIRFIHAPLLSLASGFRWTDTTQGFRGYDRKIFLDDRVAVFRNIFKTYDILAYLSYRLPRLGYRCAELPSVRIYPKGKVPTHISPIRGLIDVFSILLKACLGRYNPKR